MIVSVFARGNQFLREGRLEEAIASYQKAIELNPQFAWSYQNLGEALEKAGRIDEAIAVFRRSVANCPESPWPFYKLGVILGQQGKFQEGVGYLRRAVKLKNDVPEFYLGLGAGLVKLEQWPQAVECINQAVGMWGKTVGTLYGMSLQAEADFYLAEAKSGQGQWSEAVEFYGRSLEVNPGRVDCCMGWARALGKLGRWSEAAELYRQLWKTDEDSLPPQTMVFISNELFKLDAFSEAASCLEKVLKIHPNYPGALREQKNQYCYHAYSSWLMETVEGISDWHKADGLLTCPDWSTAAKLCQQFMNTDSRKNSLGTFREYVRTNLLLAEECWERRDTHNAKIVLQRTIESFGKYLPVSMVNSLIKSVDTIRGNQINSSEELTKNIQNQICAINADVLSLDEWLCLYDVLNWNGLFQCGLVARQKGIQQAYQQAYSKLNNAESLRIGAMAAIDRADFKIADKYIDRLSAIGFNGQKFAELRAYKCLQEGDLKGFRKLWPYQAKSVDVLFQQYIRGKSVAIVGPAPTGVADGEEINSFDVVIRFNYRGLDSMPDAREYGTKTNISLYNAHTIRYLIAQNKLGVLSELDFCLIRRPRYDLDSLGWDKNKIRLIYESDNIFYKSLNGVPAVLFDVLLQGAGKVKLFKSNFYLASQQHSEKYRGRDEANFAGFPLRKIQPVVANHDLISQMSFTRNLWKAGLIVVDEECAEVLKLSDEDYLFEIEKILSKFSHKLYPNQKSSKNIKLDSDLSISKLESLASLEPTQFETYFNLGKAHDSAGRKSEALWAYYKAFKLNPKLVDKYYSDPLNTNLLNSYLRVVKLESQNRDMYLEIGRVLEEKGDLIEAVNCYQYFIEIQTNQKEEKIDKCVLAYNNEILRSQSYSHIEKDNSRSVKSKYKRLIFVIMSVPHKILTVLSLLRFQEQQHEYKDCEDYLVLAGGNPQGVKTLLDIAKIWRFKQAINIGNIYNFLRSQKSAKMLNATVSQELIKKQIGLESVDVVYHWSPTDDIIWSLYPQARKICFGDALGILKKHSITRRFNPSDNLVVDEAYLLAPYEETEKMFTQCSINLIEPQCYKSVVEDSANSVKELLEYCNEIKQKASSSIVFLPTSYLAQSPEVKDFNKEMEIYLSYALKYSKKEDTIIVKAHPTLKAQKQSRVLVKKLEENNRHCIEIDDCFDDVPLELFSVLLHPKRLLSVLSTCGISIAYLCKCEIVMGLDEAIIAGFKKNTVNNAQWDIKQKVLYLQTKQAYKNLFPPLTHLDVASSSKFPEFPVVIKPEDLISEDRNSKKLNDQQQIAGSNFRHSAWLCTKLGQYYRALNNYGTGVLELQKATVFDSSNPWFFYSLGGALQACDKKGDAIIAYFKATELNFDSSVRQSVLERKRNRESNLRGLVVINSMENPPLGMNKSIQIVAPYLVREHGIHLEYTLSQLDKLSKTLAHKLHWYDFIIFNSAASLSSWNHCDFARLITKLKIPVFVYWHETDWTLSKWKKSFPIAHQNILEVSSHSNFAHVTASEACSDTIRRYYPASKNIHKIYECTDIPINCKPTSKSAASVPFVLNIASIQERKGTDLFVDTAIKVCARHPTVQFVWLGKATSAGQELYKNCQSKIKSCGLENRIIFPGHVESPWEHYLKNASVFFFPSRDDPFPLSILEAMCMGRSIVTFNVGGPPEALGVHGTIIDPFDIDSAATAIVNLLSKSSENFVNQDIIQRYQSLYTPEKLGDRIANHINFYLRRI